MKTLKIEMIHDVVCSWCPIGYNNINKALEILQNEVKADFHFLPFRLFPNLPQEGEDIKKIMMERMGKTEQQVVEYRKNLISIGIKAGVHYDFSKRTHYYNTIKTHLLIHWAESHSKQVTLNEALIPAYFSQGRDISNEEALLDIVKSVGLDPDEAKAALVSPKILDGFAKKEARVKALNISSVPAFIINHEHLIGGSNSVEFFVDTIKQEYLVEELQYQ